VAAGVRLNLEAEPNPMGWWPAAAANMTFLWLIAWLGGFIRMSGVRAATDLWVSSVKAWAAGAGAIQVRLMLSKATAERDDATNASGFRVTGRQGVVERSGPVKIEMTCAQLTSL